MKTILIIEDEWSIARLLTDLLEEEGYRVLVATDGAGGLRVIGNARPDMVLSNIMLPGLDGRDVARAVRTDPALRHIPVVLMSAGAEAGPSGLYTRFVKKPFNLATILELVDEQIGPPDTGDPGSHEGTA